MMAARLVVLVLVLLLAGCAATDMRERGMEEYAQGKAERMLLDGLRAYEDGNLKKSSDLLTGALREGLTFKRDKVTAYKYLGFIDCSTGRESQCREDFAAALALDPDLQLTPAEAGHPLWGPVFKSIKARSARSAK